MENIQNNDENVYEFSWQPQPASFSHSFKMHPSVIVKPLPTLPVPQQDLELTNCQDKIIQSAQFEFMESERVLTEASVTSDYTSGTGDESDYEYDGKRHVFDIETLVEECFQQMG